MIIKEPRNISLNISASTKEQLKSFFGRKVPDRKLAALVGALDGSVIDITPLGNGFISSAKHDYLQEQTRIGGIAPDDEKYIKNESFYLNGDAPEGTGLISFIRQVVAARELGFHNILTHAAGAIDDPDHLNGYYVWARFGFNAPLEEAEIKKLPRRFKGCSTLNDLMLRGGDGWWRQNGSARDMIFSLSEDELSLEILRIYSKLKGVKTDL